MTVKEWKEILDGCNEDAQVVIVSWDTGSVIVEDNQIFHMLDSNEVIIDLDYDSSQDVK